MHVQPFLRQHKFLLLALILNMVLSLAALRTVQIGQPADDASYIVLSEGLASGHGLRLINFPSMPPETAFPAGWPFILSLLAVVAPGNYEVTRLLSFGFTCASVVLVYLYLRLYVGDALANVATLLFAVAPAIVLSAGSPMSEPAYITFSLLSLYLLRCLSAAKPGVTLRTSFLIIGLAATTAASVYIRSIGYVVLATVIVWLVLRRRAAVALSVSLITVLLLIPQFLINRQTGGSLLSPFYSTAVSGTWATKIDQLASNSMAYLSEYLPNLILNVFGPNVDAKLAALSLGWLTSAARGVIVLAVLVGWIRSAFRTIPYDIYCFLFVVGTLLYHNPGGESVQARYLTPILPFLVVYCLETIRWALRILSAHLQKLSTPDYGRFAFGGIAVAVLLLSIGRDIQGAVDPLDARMTDLRPGAQWIAHHSNDNALVMTRNPIPRYLYTHRKTLDYPSGATSDDLIRYVSDWNINYVLVSPKLQPTTDITLDPYLEDVVLPTVRRRPDMFQLEYSDPIHNAFVYSVHKH